MARWKPTWAIVIDLVVGLTVVTGLLFAAAAGLELGVYVIIFLIVFAPFLVGAGIELLLTVLFVFKGGRALFYVMLAGGLVMAFLAGAALSGGLVQLIAAWLAIFTAE